MSSDFHFLVPESSHQKFGSDQHSSFIENPVLIFECARPWAKDLQFSFTFINSIRCLLLLTIRSLAAEVSEKYTIFPFSYGKAQFDLAVK